MKKKGFDLNFIAKTPHILCMTGSSFSVTYSDKKTFLISDGGIPIKELNFINRVKKELLESAKRQGFEPVRRQSKTPFFDIRTFQSREKVSFGGCTEVDINGAYWRAAFLLELISEKTYIEGLKKDKMVRLVAIGSAASEKHFFACEGEGEHVYEKSECDLLGRECFFRIAEFVGDLVNEIFERCYCLAYWVDALFCLNADAEKVRRLLKAGGFDSKSYDCEMVFERKGDLIVLEVTKEKNGEKVTKKYIKTTNKDHQKTVLQARINDLKKYETTQKKVQKKQKKDTKIPKKQ